MLPVPVKLPLKVCVPEEFPNCSTVGWVAPCAVVNLDRPAVGEAAAGKSRAICDGRCGSGVLIGKGELAGGPVEGIAGEDEVHACGIGDIWEAGGRGGVRDGAIARHTKGVVLIFVSVLV